MIGSSAKIRFEFIIAVVMVMLFAQVASANIRSSLLTNGYLNGWTNGVPDGWTLGGSSVSYETGMVCSHTSPFFVPDGKTPASMRFSSISSADKSIYQQVSVSPNTAYTWISWYKSISLRAQVPGQGYYVKIWGGNFQTELAAFTAPTGTADWTRITLPFNTGGYNYIICQVRGYNFTGTLYTSNCELILGSVTMIDSPNGDVAQIAQADGGRTLALGGNEYIETVAPAEPNITPTAKETSRGYIVYSRAASDGVLPTSKPARAEVTSKLSLFATRGETRHTQFSLYSLQSLGNVSVSISSLSNGSDGVISSSQVSIRPVRFRFAADYWSYKYAELPRILDRPGAPTAMASGANQTFWITVRVPSEAQLGTYTGTVTITPTSGTPTTVQLQLTVPNFILSDGPTWGCYYYYSALPEYTQVDRDFADMRAHGVNTLIYCPHPPTGLPPFNLNANGSITVDFTNADQMFAKIVAHGFREPVPYFPRLTSSRVLTVRGQTAGFETFDYNGMTGVRFQASNYPADARAVLTDVFSQMLNHARNAGWPKVQWYLVDEPNDPAGDAYQWALLEYPIIKSIDPAAQTLCPMYNATVVNAFDPWVDVRVNDMGGLISDNSLVQNARRKHDGVLGIRWLCQHNEYWYVRSFAGFLTARAGLDGFTEWMYGVSNGFSDPYREVRGPIYTKDVSFSYVSPVDGSLLPTITWEAAQEGIDDGRYIATLNDAIKTAWQSSDPKVRRAASAAQKTLMSTLGPSSRSTNWWTEVNMDSSRMAIADAIIKLKGAGRPEFRTWSDKTGKHKIDAVLVEKTAEKVTLKLRDGKVISVELAKLSQEDLDHLKNVPEVKK